MAEATNVEHDVGSIDDAIINQMEQIQREISESQDLVGELEDMASLVSEYQTDPVYSLKAKDLAKGYVKLRRTRGDGNCFFRAFAFACVEKLNKKELDTKKFKEKLEKAKETVLDLGYPSFTVEDFHDTFMDVIDSLKDSSSDEDLLKVFQDQGQSDYLVCYLRIVTSGYLQKNSEFYLPFLQGHATIKDFCSKEVEPMRCESDHVHISALTQALDVNVRVQYMDRGEGGKVNHHDFPEGSEPCLHLLYRPGHYDILYLAPARCSENNQMRAVLPSEVTAEIQLVSCKCANIIDLKQTSSIVKDLPPFPLQHVKRVRKHEGLII
jgi:ubiquitin thioesterase protein OTUB1